MLFVYASCVAVCHAYPCAVYWYMHSYTPVCMTSVRVRFCVFIRSLVFQQAEDAIVPWANSGSVAQTIAYAAAGALSFNVFGEGIQVTLMHRLNRGGIP